MHAVKKVPTMHYNGHTKDKKSLMRVSINRCYVTVQKKRMRTSSRSSIIDQVSFIDWQMVHKIQFGKNRIKIVPNSKKFIKQKTIKAYFDKKVLNFLRKSCNKLNYIKPVKRRWFSLSNTKDYQPINRENSRTNSSSSSSNETCTMDSFTNDRSSSSSFNEIDEYEDGEDNVEQKQQQQRSDHHHQPSPDRISYRMDDDYDDDEFNNSNDDWTSFDDYSNLSFSFSSSSSSSLSSSSLSSSSSSSSSSLLNQSTNSVNHNHHQFDRKFEISPSRIEHPYSPYIHDSQKQNANVHYINSNPQETITPDYSSLFKSLNSLIETDDDDDDMINNNNNNKNKKRKQSLS
ncbi:hypothetical protein DERF_005284 [Dermatophagoides farinae]|uniref:Uncharacterized protein n=1 Tax=Dermatophagoides farinae TaxID=6954 RepID=A0A922L703_DERFA|nr:hypothetical protein DERF_005284 [Dermatophagoides farinae]